MNSLWNMRERFVGLLKNMHKVPTAAEMEIVNMKI